MQGGGEIRKPDKVLFPELSYKIVKVLFDMHNELGGRYQEKYYQRAVALAFDKKSIKYKKELAVDLKFQGETIGRYLLDFLIDDKIIVELKTVVRFCHDDIRQVLGYLKANNLKLGILVNFRGEELIYKRIINSI